MTGDRHDHLVDIVSTVLLALAAVAIAWSGYQASKWHGEQALAQSRAIANRVEASRASGAADREAQIDVATFIQWIDAHAQGDDSLAAFYRRRFRDEFKPAFEAWVATKPFTNAAAPPTPFAMPEYRLEASDEAERLEATAAAGSESAKAANERADNYMLAVVLFASSLFFAGISTKLQTVRARSAILGLGCVLFVGTLIWVLTFPIQLSV
jgi:hypothetical protein